LDKGILLIVLFLLGLGLVQVFSSSYIYATEVYNDGLFFFRKQLAFSVLSLLVILVWAWMPWKWAWRGAIVLWAAATLGIALTFVPGLAIKVGGAARWIRLPLDQRIEPGELFRATYPVVLAFALVRSKAWLAAIFSLPLLAVLYQPDFGTFAICFALALSLIFVNGVKWRYILAGSSAFVCAIYVLIINEPYRMARVQAYLDPWSDPAEKGFQVIQSMLSLYSGGLWGVGLGQGQGKLFFLPEAHTDFTLAVLGEEMGFIGYIVVVMLYGFLLFRGTQIAMRSEGQFERLAAFGLTVVLSLSVFVNVGVVTGLLPTKGLTLPFLSYGGSSLIGTGLIIGLLLNLDRQSS